MHFACIGLHFDVLGTQHAGGVIRRFDLPSRRVGGVHPHEGREVLERLSVETGPVGFRGAAGRAGREEDYQCSEDSHARTIARIPAGSQAGSEAG